MNLQCLFAFLTLLSYGQTMPHLGADLSKEHADSFEKLCSITLHNGVVVNKYRSRLTGMHVILARVEGPIVSGYFTLATEAGDDDGLPHTLEHLVFLGSEEYPYKGILDLLANRCLASGTNAWTDTDHTAYTIETAGSEGFLNHLPIYLDHLLYPTLTDSAFMTEVYHVTGEGEDAGVVYSEMQSRENSGADRSFLALQRAFYPETECGYRYETGGTMQNLRNTTTNERIKAYHREFYRPENLHLIITGQVDPASLFDVLVKFEDKKILSQGPLPPYTRPWQRPVAPLTEAVRKDVVYPSNTHDTGRVLVAWRGPSAGTEYRQLLSLTVLMEYLTYSSVSALPATFVEIDDPLASDVTHYVSENQASNCYLKFTGVPLEHMEEVEPAIYATLASLYAGTGKKRIDLSELHEFLENLILTQHSELETSPRDTLAYAIIGDALYGSSCSDLEHRVDKVSWYRELLTRPLSFWLGLMKEYLLDKPSVVILARPSAAEAQSLQQEDEQRVKLRKQQLGVNGLKALEDELHEAKLFNEIPPPPEMLSILPIPSPSSVLFHGVETYTNHPSSDESRSTLSPDPAFFALSELPLRMELDQINTNFVSLTAILDSSSLSPARRLYLPLLLELFFESSVLKDGTTLLPYETVVRRLSAEMVDYSAEMGLSISGTSRFSCGPFCNYVLLFMKFEWSRYSEGVAWLNDVLYNLRPTVSRLSIKTSKLLNSIDDYSREASKILSLMHRGVIFDRESNKNQVNLVRQLAFLTDISHRLHNETQAAAVLEEVTEILAVLCSPDNLAVHISANFTQLAETVDVVQPWRDFVHGKTFQRRARALNIVPDSDSRAFSGVIPLDMPQFQAPVRQLILEGIESTPVDVASNVHKPKKDVTVFENVRSFGKSIGDVLDSDNDLSDVTPKADLLEDEETEDPSANKTNHFPNANTNGGSDKRVIIIHSGSVVHHNSGGSIDSNMDHVLNSKSGSVPIPESDGVIHSNTGSLHHHIHHDIGRNVSHDIGNVPHQNTDSVVKTISGSAGSSDASVADSGVRTLSLQGSLTKSSTALETEEPMSGGVPEEPTIGGVSEEPTIGGVQEPTAWVYGLPEADSGYLQQSAVSITHYTHWHLPALLTAIQFFTQLEGPMWREIRGRGLAYNYDLQLLPNEGLVTLKLTRAAQLLEAYKQSISILRAYINGSRDWDPLLLESAKSSLMFEVIYREDTVSDVVQQSLLSYYRKVPLSYNRDLLSLIAGVSLEEVRLAAHQYLMPLLYPSSSRTVVVCDPSEVDHTITVLSSLGHTVEEVTSLSNSWFT